eukprot:scaffold64_cov338-Pavlova_lutheri.AAC.22
MFSGNANGIKHGRSDKRNSKLAQSTIRKDGMNVQTCLHIRTTLTHAGNIVEHYLRDSWKAGMELKLLHLFEGDWNDTRSMHLTWWFTIFGHQVAAFCNPKSLFHGNLSTSSFFSKSQDSIAFDLQPQMQGPTIS